MRSLLTLEAHEAIERLNDVRRRGSAGELAQVDRVLWISPASETPLIPALFPTKPQTSEDFGRLDALSLEIQLGVIELHLRSNLKRVRALIEAVAELNRSIIDGSFSAAVVQVARINEDFGHSHYLLRKTALLRVVAPAGAPHEAIEGILVRAGLPKNNLIVSSLVHCYQEEQDFLSMKRSVMNLPDRGSGNQFTRDISRVPFHPFSRSQTEFRGHLQSALQSSLIDALVIAKFNSHFIPLGEFPLISDAFANLEAAAPSIDNIARLQEPAIDNESEHIFYKRSSAWLESADIARYRRLLDHFYDSPDAEYFEITDSVLADVGSWAAVDDLDSLATGTSLAKHTSVHLRALENTGVATRSALFNFCLHKSQGYTTVGEENLVHLMGTTRDLAKTISSAFASNLAKSIGSDTSKLILYLLIAKKSRNERDDHLLRKAVQEITIRRFERSLVLLITYLESRSKDISIYAYEVFTEDFIAKLYDLIPSPSEVIDTRAALHRWMGQLTGDKLFSDRARTLLIDHQINRVRNEIDDHRIYVDVARFHEWISEEILRDINAALSSIEHKGFELSSTESVLGVLTERCYATFCSHRAFGISSYLGRRIRHGTFKGHLYSGVVGIERDERFTQLLEDTQVGQAWRDWKLRYEERIDGIIRERLHVASPSKREGLLKPSLATPQKTEIIVACTRALVKDFVETKTSAAAGPVITEYCWRLAEVDLKAFNAYLKGQRSSLVDAEGLSNIKFAAPTEFTEVADEFYRAVTRAISEKLMTMQMWFKRPLNVSPKASLTLLYKAVVEEVRDAYPRLQAPLDMDPANDIELFGGAYHVLYDSFYVVVYNAAKHGKSGGLVEPKFSIVMDESSGKSAVLIEISSEIRDEEDESAVQKRLSIGPDDDVDNAQTYENRSGIPKLYHLQSADSSFSIRSISCISRRVTIVMSYRLEH